MAFVLLKELMEMQQQKTPTAEDLQRNGDFQSLRRLAPKLYQMLEDAWNADITAYANSGGQAFQSLFMASLSPRGISIYASNAQNDRQFADSVARLKRFHSQFFPSVAPTDVWAHEPRYRRNESAKVDMTGYNLLREELVRQQIIL